MERSTGPDGDPGTHREGSRGGDDFYRRLEPCHDFSQALSGGCFSTVPDDWIVIATDVRHSTEAIEAGKYKDVTIAGAVSTIAVANITGSLDFPFFFGGDGMTFLLPGRYRREVCGVLADVRRVVHASSGLDLRAGIIAVADLRRLGATLRIGKVRITDRYTQAVADGSAMALVDEILKERREGPMDRPGESSADAELQADFSGFSCRWQDIPSSRGETLSLIIQATGTTGDGRQGLPAAQDAIDSVVGDRARAHPLSVEAQITASRNSVAGAEATYRNRGVRNLRLLLLRARIWLEVRVVRLAIRTGLPLRSDNKILRETREDNISNSDVYKIDGTLKMTLAISPEDRHYLLTLLADLKEQGAIRFGYHVSDRAIMTCLIHTNRNDEVHFVDSADGGYAAAAKMLKQAI